MNLVLSGPPASGKTAVGKILAEWLGREFVDTDALIEARAGKPVREIFAEDGETAFRQMEADVACQLAGRNGLVISCGGGLMLDSGNRAALEATGRVVLLTCAPDEILRRLQNDSVVRPLIAGDDPRERLVALLESRREHYDSFALKLDTTDRRPEAVAEEALRLSGEEVSLRIGGLLGHDYLLGYGLTARLAAMLAERGLTGQAVIVTDSNVSRISLTPNPSPSGRGESPPSLLGKEAGGLGLGRIILPSGEGHKTLDSARLLYDAFLDRDLDRKSVVVAVGGGVIGDLAGFAAATFMRGIAWVAVPTTLLAMVDASIGGKTAVDLPRGKNLVGAFHPPRLVLADLDFLCTLPEAEIRSGLAEVVKAGIIGDAKLFESLEATQAHLPITNRLALVRRAAMVKAGIVERDPYEKGERATLNLGHTVGHGVEAASAYRLRHGEAVAIGLCVEARIAERLGLAEEGLTARIASVLRAIGLPTDCPGLDPSAIRAAMSADKKKSAGRLKFALPKKVGEVVWGVEVDDSLVEETLRSITQE